MAVIRIYLLPKGYVDVKCDYVSIEPIMGGHKATVIGGEQNGKEYNNAYGARVIKD